MTDLDLMKPNIQILAYLLIVCKMNTIFYMMNINYIKYQMVYLIYHKILK